jgi:serine/threonine-protein kinase RsbW
MPAREMMFRFPATLHYLTPLRLAVEAFCTDALASDSHGEQVYQLQLAVSELVTNIINHAYRDAAPGAVNVRATSADGAVTLDFFDTGAAFTPNREPTLPNREILGEGGYGSFIIQQCVDRVTYTREDDTRNHWRLEKQFGKRGGD